ncbi:unnamed protein product [Pleuronectes platessa]|uniref:Uncharacterized protein n=1 Tax=Pleuronectes platessa TaxID=8262 RepID=A0A9N7Z6K5_PLEPL|nr:unnamed protein product [Pleuronectes platessa]
MNSEGTLRAHTPAKADSLGTAATVLQRYRCTRGRVLHKNTRSLQTEAILKSSLAENHRGSDREEGWTLFL